MFVLHCLRAEGGIIAPVYMKEAVPLKITEKDISLKVRDYGIDVKIKDLLIPIPEYILDYFVENSRITLYLADDSVYFWESVLAVEIPKVSLIEAKGIYRYKRKNQGN